MQQISIDERPSFTFCLFFLRDDEVVNVHNFCASDRSVFLQLAYQVFTFWSIFFIIFFVLKLTRNVARRIKSRIKLKYNETPVTRTLKGNEEQF